MKFQKIIRKGGIKGRRIKLSTKNDGEALMKGRFITLGMIKKDKFIPFNN